HNTAHILKFVKQGSSHIGKIVALLKEFNRADGGIRAIPIDGPTADRGEKWRTDHIADTARRLCENTEGHTENAHADEIEIRRNAGYRSVIDIRFTEERG